MVTIDANSLSFTCDADSNNSSHTYPRTTDPFYNTSIAVEAVSGSTFTVNVGKVSGGQVKTYPRASGCTGGNCVGGADPFYDKPINIDAVTDYEITLNVGIASGTTAPHTWAGGLAKGAVVAGAPYTHTWSGGTANNAVTSGGSYAHQFVSAVPGAMTRSGETLKLLKDALTFTCSQDNDATDHSYPRVDDPFYDTALPIWSNGSTSRMTVEGATYNTVSGMLTMTILNHGLTTTDEIRIENYSLTFTCGKDNHLTEHSYPRPNDPFAARWLKIKSTTDHTFTVFVGKAGAEGQFGHLFVKSNPHGIVKRDNNVTINVGATPTVAYTPSAATYNPSTGALALTIDAHSHPAPTTHTPTDVAYNPVNGVMTLTIAGHNFSNGEKIKIADGGLKLSCNFGGASGTAAQKDYPRAGDPVSNKWIEIFNVTTNTFDVQVLDAIPSTNVDTHTFVSAVSGCVSKANSTIKIAPDSLIMTCAMDGSVEKHTYPRSNVATHTAGTGTIYNPVTGKLTVNIPTESFTPTAITYNPTSGDMTMTISANAGSYNISGATYSPSAGTLVLTIGTHSLTTNDRIKFTPESIKFTCDFNNDNNQTVKSYPRAAGASTATGADYAYDTWLDIAAVGATTIEVNVNGGAGAITDISNHTFNSALDGAIQVGHGIIPGNKIKIAPNSLTMTCDYNSDGNTTQKTYPRASGASTTSGADYAYETWLQVRAADSNTITVNVNGGQGAITDTTTHNFVSASANAVTLGHGMVSGTPIKIKDNSLKFRCLEDQNATIHTYPRATDPASDKWLFISKVTDSQFEVDILQGTTPTNTTTHTYAGSETDGIVQGDPLVAQAIPIDAVGAATVTVNALDGYSPSFTPAHGLDSVAPYRFTPSTVAYDPATGHMTITVPTAQHTASAVTYNPVTGDMEITIGSHSLAVGQEILIAPNSLIFTCDYNNDGNTTNKSYPRATGAATPSGADYAYNNHLPIRATTATTIRVNVNGGGGAVTDTSAHNFVSATAQGISIFHGIRSGEKIRITNESIFFRCAKDNYSSIHQYPRTTDPASGRWLTVVNPTNNTFTVDVGVAATADQFTHTFETASVNSITRAIVTTGGNYHHTFKSGLTNGIRTGGEYTHTFVSAAHRGIHVAGDSIYIADDSLRFTCSKDAHATQHDYPRASDPSSKQVLEVKNASANTFVVNVGKSPSDDVHDHKFVSADSNCITKSDYKVTSCSDVYTTSNNLISILTDTISNAALATPVDHLATVTDLGPVHEYVGGTIHSYMEVPFKVTYDNPGADLVYTDRIDIFSRYRFRDAAELIRQNRGAIVDKAAYDMLQKYPALAQDMPRNQNGASTDGTERCKTDLGQVVDGIATDIEQGGNKNVITAAGFYLGLNDEIQHIRLQLPQSVYVHERLIYYLKQAVDGTLTQDNTENLIVGDWGITNNDSTTQYDVYNASYIPSTGDMTLTVASNTGTYSVTGAVYNPTSGDLALTIGVHTLTTNDQIGIKTESLVFTCDYNGNGNQTQKAYPRSFGANTTNGADYAYDNFLPITAVNQGGGTITVNVNGGQGAVTDTTTHNFVLTASATDCITVGHGFSVGDSIQIADDSLTFSCQMDAGATNKTYPRATDPFYQRPVTIDAVTATTITVNVGSTPEVKYTATNAEYNPTGGNLKLWIGNHNLKVGNPIRINPNSLKFRCFMDNYMTLKSYPRTTDPKYNLPMEITEATSETITVLVGTTPKVQHNVSNATYNPTTGVMVLTIGVNHGLLANTSIKLANESLTFTCDFNSDGNVTQKSYPRSSTAATGTGEDYAYDTAINIDSVDQAAGTITINVNGGQGAITDTTTHNFVSALSGAVISGGDYLHQFASADIEGIIAGGDYVHAWAGGTASNAISVIGDCADVKTNIEALITSVNDIIAPTGLDYHIAGNRLYFNREYIAQDVTSSIVNEFTYQAGSANYQAFTFPNPGGVNGQLTCERDVELIVKSMISDLQTGGNNSTIAALEYYVAADGTLTQVEDEIMATVYGMSVLKIVGAEAIKNNVYLNSESIPFGGYASQGASTPAYRDTETTTDIDEVVGRWHELADIVIDFFAPGKEAARSGMKNILFNANYYKNELNNLVNTQFGNGQWIYNDFVDELLGNIVQDSITTDIEHKHEARVLQLAGVVGSYVVGEIVTDQTTGGYAMVLEWDAKDNRLYIGPYMNNLPVAIGNTITGQTTGSGVIAAHGVSAPFDWYTHPANVEILRNARLITSTVQDQIVSGNVGYQYPEDLTSGNTLTNATITSNALVGPDNSLTADKIVTTAVAGEHNMFRNYSLSAYETWDSGSVKFDTTNETFDTGEVGTVPSQQFTYSVFLKAAEFANVRVMVSLDEDTATKQQAFFDVDLTTGTTGSLFTPQGGVTVNDHGIIPYGSGWYRAYITITCSFGFSQLRQQVTVKNATGQTNYTGDGTSGIYGWGLKLTKNVIDPYASGSGEIFYADTAYNIKTYTINQLEVWIDQALHGGLANPSPQSGFVPYFSESASADYDPFSIARLTRYSLDIIRNQLLNSTYYTDITVQHGIKLATKTYGTRDIPVGIAGGLNASDYLYGMSSGAYGELESIGMNEGEVVEVYQRFRIDGDIIDGPFIMNETCQKQGDATVTGRIYGFFEDENFKYLDVAVTGGTFATLDYVVGATNTTTAQINAIEDRIQITDLVGEFGDNIPFKGYNSGATAVPTGFLKAEAAVTDNSGGKLTVDTETLTGTFETTATIYPATSKLYVDVLKYDGLDLNIGHRISSTGHIRIGISIIDNKNVFVVGNKLNKITNGIMDINNYGYITEVDIDNNLVYISLVDGNIQNGDQVGDFGLGTDPVNPQGHANVVTKLVVDGAATALVQDIQAAGINKRFYLSDVRGTFSGRDGIMSKDNYKGAILSKVDLRGRVERAFRGFDGVQTTFKLTIENGTKYFPDPAGHMLLFINGVLQPPGSANAYTAFSDNLQFTEAPDLGASFTGFYVGKLRQLDDISFEFDSLRQSFNLKRDDVFYSLTLTDGVQSSTILPENNIICSLNGVIQEPGVGFELVGSRIIFSEIPRVGSTFVAFSYVGSEADVDAAEVVPPIEVGDFIDIQGETEDREVAVIESSNSLITFDYLGSVFGQDAKGAAQLTSGTIEKVQVTSGGSGYTTRPTVRVDSISGFDGNIRALVGVAGVEISNAGSGYENPIVSVETSVPDNWTAPDLSLYGEEPVDPETP